MDQGLGALSEEFDSREKAYRRGRKRFEKPKIPVKSRGLLPALCLIFGPLFRPFRVQTKNEPPIRETTSDPKVSYRNRISKFGNRGNEIYRLKSAVFEFLFLIRFFKLKYRRVRGEKLRLLTQMKNL